MTLAGRGGAAGQVQRWCAALATVVGLVLAAGPATAAGTARLGDPVVSGRELRIPVTVGQLPPDTALDAASVQVQVDGQAVAASAARTSRAGTVAPRSVTLLMDVSGSMRGTRLEHARAAAMAFVDAVPADVTVGLVTFAGEVTTVVAPTRDRAPLRSAVLALRARGATQLHDGVIAAVGGLGAVGDRSVVLLSDGAHEGSPTTTEQAVAAVTASGVALSAVDVGGDEAAVAQLTRLAAAGRGTLVRAADGASLTAAFQAAAREFSEQVAVVAALPQEASGRDVPVAVSIAAGGTVHTGTTRVRVPVLPPVAVEARAVEVPATVVAPVRPTLLWIGVGGVFAALLLLSVLLLGPGRGRADDSRTTRRLIDAYTLGARQVAAPVNTVDDSPVAQALLRIAGRVVGRRDRGNKTARRLEQAALTLRPAEFLLLQSGAALVLALVFAFVFGGGVLGFGLGAVVGVLGASFWLRQKADRRCADFVDGLPDALQLIASGLGSGYSFAQALDSVVRDGAQPVSGEIGRALAESRLGVSLEDALDNVAERMGSDDMGWIVMAVRVQRDTGGNLAEVLHTVFETMRERARIRREVRTLSAEGRMSAWVLIGLPIFMAGFQLLFRRDYMRPLYTEPVGIIMLVCTVLSVLVGAVWTNKLVKVEA